MIGYKVYFNGEKFLMEDSKSLVEDVGSDSVVSWYAGSYSAKFAVDNLNENHKSKPNELIKTKDFLVRTCRDCGTYFILGSIQVEWFERRNLKLPCRCIACREKKKKSK